MALKGNSTSISANTTLVTMPATLEGAVHGLQIGNTTSNNINVEFKFKDSSKSAETTFLVAPVSANSTFTFQKPINLNSQDAIICSSTATGLVGITSTFEDSTVNLGVLSTAGVYTSATTYSFGDLVSDGAGNTLISTFNNNVNRGIANASAFQTFASKGDTGDVSLAGTAELTNKSFADSVTVSASLTANTVNDVDGDLRTVPTSRTFGAGVTDAATASALDVGNFILMTGTAASVQNLTIPSGVFSTGDVFTLVNTPYGGKTAASTTTISAAATAFVAGGTSATAVISLGFNGVATVLFASANGCFITGNVE